MKVVWHSNAPWAASGYGVQTAHAVSILRELGHEVAVSVMFGLDGNVLNMDGVLLVPGVSQGDPYGARTVPRVAQDWGADVLITLLDAWVFSPEAMREAGQRWVPLAPIDHEPAPRDVRDKVCASWHPAAMTRGSQAEMAGWPVNAPPVFLPHTYDPGIYRDHGPDHAAEWRERFGIPADAFVVAMVAANKGTPSRKHIPVVIEAFAGLLHERPDSYLVLHTEMDRRLAGINVYDTLAFFDIPEDRVRYSDQRRPAKPENVAALMAAADVLVNPSAGEGFGVPILEAAACGTPAIVGGWTAMPEVAGPGAVIIPREAAMRVLTLQCGFQYVPSPASVLDGLLHLSGEQGTAAAAERSRRCLEHAAEWSRPAVTKLWRAAFRELEQHLENDDAQPDAAAVVVE